VYSHSILSAGQIPFILITVVLVINSLNVQSLVTVEPSDDLVKHIAIFLFGICFEFIITSVVKVAEEIFFGWFGDQLFAILLGVNYIPEPVVRRECE